MTVGMGRGAPRARPAGCSMLFLLKCWTLPNFRVIRAVLLNLSKAPQACWLGKTPEYRIPIKALSFNRDWKRL